MGIAERREREKEQRRRDIIDAAEEVFFARGWQTATMDDVAGAAELSKATLYLYFKNKEELYAAILSRGSEILHELFREAVDTNETGIEQTAAIGRAYMRFHEEHRDYYDAMLYFDAKGFDTCDDCEFGIKCAESRENIMGLVTRAVSNGVADGTLRADLDPVKTAVILWASSSGVLSALATAGDNIHEVHGFDKNAFVDEFFEFTFHAIAADPIAALDDLNAGKDDQES
jgi:TetR/AcrR family transcriptional regulator